ncbi:MAG: transglutaminase family protein [Lachnospira sp.]
MICMVLSYLLSVVLTSAVISVYDYPFVSVMTPLVLILCALAFGMCYLAERKKLLGGIIIVGAFVLTIYIIGVLSEIGGYSSDMYFWQWVLNRADDSPVVLPYVLALLIGAAMFLTAVVYYFSIVLHRVSFLTLVSLIPCVLYVKVTAEIDNVYLIMIATLNLLIHLQHNKIEKIRHIGVKTSTVSSIVFAMGILLVASVIPKEEKAYFYEEFERIFLNGDTTSELNGSYGSINEFSGNADNYKQTINRKMYKLSGNVGEYMKRQTFDAYDYEKNRWYPLYDNSNPSYSSMEWRDYAVKLKTEELQMAIKQAASYDIEFAEKYNLYNVVESNLVVSDICRIYVQAQNFRAGYYLTPVGGYEVQPLDASTYRVTEGGAYLREYGNHDSKAAYEVDYYEQEGVYNKWIALGAADFDNDTAYEMLLEMEQILENNDDPFCEVAGTYVKQIESVYDYRELVSDDVAAIPKEIKDLAKEITKDCENDYQKAKILRKYFYDEGFVYDLEYEAPDDSPVYFLTKGKTGTCSDFASAYVLLARAAGLTARYVEGYVPEKDEVEGVYYISDRSSHAYAEVFIQNTGWMVIDPTVPGEAKEEKTGFVEWLKQLKMDYGLISVIIGFIVVLAIVGVMLKIMIPFVLEMIFMLRASNAKPEKCAFMLYRKLSKGRESLTPGELADMYELKGCDISYLVLYVENILYSQKMSMKAERKRLLNIYIKAKKML